MNQAYADGAIGERNGRAEVLQEPQELYAALRMFRQLG